MMQLAIWPGDDAGVADPLLDALDAILAVRVELHRTRLAGSCGVALYLRGLRVVRALEDLLEAARGPVPHSRAFEIACLEVGRPELLVAPPSAPGRAPQSDEQPASDAEQAPGLAGSDLIAAPSVARGSSLSTLRTSRLSRQGGVS